jgi:two-component system chemotaxis sensor kinase CheA
MIGDEVLWQEFLAESEEHLDRLERMLGTGAADRPAVDTLFRGFHSLKGMSDALGADGMKLLAHRCEDILGVARQGRVVVAGEVADALLAAVDTLRRQRGALAERRQDTPAPPALLARLGALASGEATAAAKPATAPEQAGDGLLASFASLLAGEAAGLLILARGRDAAAAHTATELAAAAGAAWAAPAGRDPRRAGRDGRRCAGPDRHPAAPGAAAGGGDRRAGRRRGAGAR